jgi:hypothetical protein
MVCVAAETERMNLDEGAPCRNAVRATAWGSRGE